MNNDLSDEEGAIGFIPTTTYEDYGLATPQDQLSSNSEDDVTKDKEGAIGFVPMTSYEDYGLATPQD